jgi:Pyridine nucleotide-disulphide oxidoreductase
MTENLIIGAGPAGLAMAAQMRVAKRSFELLEQSQHAGNAWRNHYERLHLHTVKEHSALPHLPFPAHYPRYVARQEVVDYFDDYCQHFDLQPIFNQTVKAVFQQGKNWIVETQDRVFEAKRVVVATGYNRVPFAPTWPNQDKFEGQILHSSLYRNGQPFVGKRVLVVGMGNSGAEIALDLHEHGAESYVSVRGNVSIVRREFRGRPSQQTAIVLSKLPAWLYDWITRRVQKLSVGDLSAYGLVAPPYAPSQLVREFGKIPVIDVGTIDAIKAGHIQVFKGIERFEARSIVFANGQELPFDAVILATGYRSGLSDFLPASVMLNERGYPPQLWDVAHPNLYFLGFSIPIAGTFRNIQMDSTLILNHILRHEQ